MDPKVATLCAVFIANVAAAHSISEIPYCHQSQTTLTLDLALPDAGQEVRPMVVFVHGGGWAWGSKSSYRSRILDYAKRGYVAASIDYRLTSRPTDKDQTPDRYQVGARFPAPVEDVKCAVRWARAHATDYGIDPERIALIGSSAGGGLALLAGASKEESFKTGSWLSERGSVQAIVNWYGTTDFISRYAYHRGRSRKGRKTLERLFGGAPSEGREVLYRQAGALAWTDVSMPPVLSFHGQEDALVPSDQATGLHRRLQELRIPNQLFLFENEGHGFSGKNQKRAEILEALFLRRFLMSPPKGPNSSTASTSR